MNYVFRCEMLVTYQNLLHVRDSLGLGQTFFEGFVEIRVAQLGYDVCVILGGVDLMQTKDVRQGLEFLQHLDLTLKQNLVYFIF